MGLSPMPMILIWQVTRSTFIVPTSSWVRLAEKRVVPATWMRPCSLSNSGEMPVTIWDGVSPCKDQAISANPKRGDDHRVAALFSLTSTSGGRVTFDVPVGAIVGIEGHLLFLVVL